MIRRRHLVALSLAAPGVARAQARLARLGMLSSGRFSIDEFLRIGLPELAREGFVEGRTLDVVTRSADGDAARLIPLAAEIVATRPDVAIAVSNPAAHALRAQDPRLPIVMGFAGTDPVADGLAQSLARPGGSVTGVVMLAEELDVKRVELLRTAFPARRRIGYLAGTTFVPGRVPAVEAAARALGAELLAVTAGGPETYEAAFAALRAQGVEALAIGSFPAFSTHAADLARRAAEARLPTACEWRAMAEAGCLLSLGPASDELRRRTARIAARVLRGEPPGGIPMERADRFETVVNLRTAQALGVELPALLLAAATELIE
jgi:putative ABC transport system substrate-binding protein